MECGVVNPQHAPVPSGPGLGNVWPLSRTPEGSLLLSPSDTPSSRSNRSIPFIEHLDIRIVHADKGRGRLELDVDPRHLRDIAITHGGVIATLLDSFMGMAAGSVSPPKHHVVTAQLNVNFIRPAWQGESLI